MVVAVVEAETTSNANKPVRAPSNSPSGGILSPPMGILSTSLPWHDAPQEPAHQNSQGEDHIPAQAEAAPAQHSMSLDSTLWRNNSTSTVVGLVPAQDQDQDRVNFPPQQTIKPPPPPKIGNVLILNSRLYLVIPVTDFPVRRFIRRWRVVSRLVRRGRVGAVVLAVGVEVEVEGDGGI